MEASVCRKSSKRPLSKPERFLAESTPSVTVWSRPKGLPMAITHSPTSTLSESPKRAGCILPAPSTWTTARSLFGSEPTSLPETVRPSRNVTFTSSAPSTTWLLVSTCPCPSKSTPEPRPRWRGDGRPSSPKKRSKGVPSNGFSSRPPRLLTLMRTTEAPTRAATPATVRLRATACSTCDGLGGGGPCPSTAARLTSGSGAAYARRLAGT